jgi:hypothetical protein|tara:strand:- start:57 stop:284 length:228 start_codon:yes stop_codon:yes gene_type:complete
MVLGKLALVENTGSARGSSHYNQLTYINSSGEVEHILLTDRELESGRDRAAKNPEDIRQVKLWDKLVAWAIRLLG